MNAFEKIAHVRAFAFFGKNARKRMRDEWQRDGCVAAAYGMGTNMAVDFALSLDFLDKTKKKQAAPIL